MATEYYLVRDDNKTLFDLGKGYFYFLEEFLDGKPYQPITNTLDPIKAFTINNPDILADYYVEVNESDLDFYGYWKQVFQEVCNWAEGNLVFLVSDSDDFIYEAKREHGYKVTGSRYIN